MRRHDILTIRCPGCERTLPAESLRCHFCGDDLAFAGRPEKPPEGFVPGTKEYQFEKLYRAVAIFWIIDGCLAILVSLEILPPWASAISNMLVSYLGVALSTGFLIAVLGVGMLMKLPLARKLVSGFCWFRVIAGLFGLGIILRSGDFNLAKHNIYVLAILNVVDTLFAAFQIWLLSVTDYDVLN